MLENFIPVGTCHLNCTWKLQLETPPPHCTALQPGCALRTGKPEEVELRINQLCTVEDDHIFHTSTSNIFSFYIFLCLETQNRRHLKTFVHVFSPYGVDHSCHYGNSSLDVTTCSIHLLTFGLIYPPLLITFPNNHPYQLAHSHTETEAEIYTAHPLHLTL